MTVKRKLAISALVPLGIFFCSLEIARIIWFWTHTDDKSDSSWSSTEWFCLSTAAYTAGILRTCMPIMMPWLYRNAIIFREFFQVRFGRCEDGQPPGKLHGSRGFRRFGASNDDVSDGMCLQAPNANILEELESFRASKKGHKSRANNATADNVVIHNDIEVIMEEARLLHLVRCYIQTADRHRDRREGQICFMHRT